MKILIFCVCTKLKNQKYQNIQPFHSKRHYFCLEISILGPINSEKNDLEIKFSGDYNFYKINGYSTP